MTIRAPITGLPPHVRIRAHRHPRGPNDPRMATARRAAAPPSPVAAGAVAAIEMSSYRVIVTEHRTRGLVESATSVSPPQTDQRARSLIAPLAGAIAGASGGGPRRHPVADGQRLIGLERQP